MQRGLRGPSACWYQCRRRARSLGSPSPRRARSATHARSSPSRAFNRQSGLMRPQGFEHGLARHGCGGRDAHEVQHCGRHVLCRTHAGDGTKGVGGGLSWQDTTHNHNDGTCRQAGIQHVCMQARARALRPPLSRASRRGPAAPDGASWISSGTRLHVCAVCGVLPSGAIITSALPWSAVITCAGRWTDRGTEGEWGRERARGVR